MTRRGLLDGVRRGRSPVTGTGRSLTLIVAWAAVLLFTGAPQIVAGEVFGRDPAWLLPVQVAGLVVLFGATVVVNRLRLLRSLVLAMGAVKVVAAVPDAAVTGLVGSSPLLANAVGVFLRAVVAATLLAVLWLLGHSRADLFLRRGDLSATVGPTRLPGLEGGQPWRTAGLAWAAGIVSVTLAFLVLGGASYAFWTLPPSELAVVAAAVVVTAALNAFAEEAMFRAAPLSALRDGVGASQALLLAGGFFALSHYFGVPGGLPGLAMTFFLAWFLSKSVLETGGIGYAWAVHFALDVLIVSSWYL